MGCKNRTHGATNPYDSYFANNLANVNTVAFKKDRAVFEDLLYQNVRQPGASADAQTIAPTGLMIGTGSRIIATEKIAPAGKYDID